MSTDQLLATLGLTRGATAEDIKQAFRDLAQVWHPDRFAHDPRLRAKAEEKFKQINAAYQELTKPGRRNGAASTASFSGSGSGGGQQPRFVRVALPGVEVRFGDRRARLINLSISGGQLLLEHQPTVQSHEILRLEAEGELLELDARVVRVSPPSPSARLAPGATTLVSIKFVDLSTKQQRAIPRFYNLLLAHATEKATR